MTFVASIDGKISTNNSTDVTLAADATFTGTADNISRYGSIEVTIHSDVSSAALGLNIQTSQDGVNWDTHNKFTFDVKSAKRLSKRIKTSAKFARVSYTNGSIIQTEFRLQTRYHFNSDEKRVAKLDPILLDSFGRMKVSEPRTTVSQKFITSKMTADVFERVTGSASSVFDSSGSCIDLSTTGTGSVLRRSRRRAFYQPGKSLLVYMTGVLNSGGSNDLSISTRIGYFDDNDGFFFEYNDGKINIVRRSSVTGSIVETRVSQSEWNTEQFDDPSFVLDPTKAQIYWFTMEWLGVGFCKVGVIIEGVFYVCHEFKHANRVEKPYIKNASLPFSYEINSASGGSGSLRQICYTGISEGGLSPIGARFSADTGVSTRSVSNTITPLIAIRLRSGVTCCTTVKISGGTAMSTTGANCVVRMYRVYDTSSTTVLPGSSWTPVNVATSAVEYSVASSSMDVTGFAPITSQYFANNVDATRFDLKGTNRYLTMNPDGVSDIWILAAAKIGAGTEDMLSSINWVELI